MGWNRNRKSHSKGSKFCLQKEEVKRIMLEESSDMSKILRVLDRRQMIPPEYHMIILLSKIAFDVLSLGREEQQPSLSPQPCSSAL